MIDWKQVYKLNKKWHFSEDILQDAIIKYLENYDLDKLNEGLLYTICNNLLKHNYNIKNKENDEIKEYRYQAYQLIDDDFTSREDREDKEELNSIRLLHIRFFLEKNIKTNNRIIFYTYLFSDLTQEEIGLKLNIKRTTITYSLKKTIEKLAKHFNRTTKSFNKSIRKHKRNNDTTIDIFIINK